jgi:hypothetical protein
MVGIIRNVNNVNVNTSEIYMPDFVGQNDLPVDDCQRDEVPVGVWVLLRVDEDSHGGVGLELDVNAQLVIHVLQRHQLHEGVHPIERCNLATKNENADSKMLTLLLLSLEISSFKLLKKVLFKNY